MATTAPAPAAAAGPAPAVPDLKKRLAPLFNPPRDPVLVDVPELGYLMIDGQGAPDEGADYPATDFQRAFAALFPVVYTIKFRLKRDGLAMPVLPLEALWFTGQDEAFDMNVAPNKWGWRAMLAVSDDVTLEVFSDALAEVRRKKGNSEALDRLRLERWREGRSAQVMHIGPYAEERPTIERLHAFIAAQGLRPRGAHHEIYLGDPRRADLSKLRTVLRQPVNEGCRGGLGRPRARSRVSGRPCPDAGTPSTAPVSSRPDCPPGGHMRRHCIGALPESPNLPNSTHTFDARNRVPDRSGCGWARLSL